MRPFIAPSLVSLLLFASPALAQIGAELDPDKQTAEYGVLFGYVCGVGGGIGVIVFIYFIIKGMVAEGTRGRKVKSLQEQMLDDIPEDKKNKQPRGLYLGEKVPDWKTKNRLAATEAALKMLGKSDDWFDRTNMATFADQAFRAVKSAIEARSPKKIKRLLTVECLEKVKSQMDGLRKEKEVHIFGKLDITGIEIVHFDLAGARTSHTFAALISARSKDFIQAEKSGEVLRGDKKVYDYQEFWCFRRTKDMWLLDQIRTSSDMDVIIHQKCVLAQADLDKLAKKASPEILREFVGK